MYHRNKRRPLHAYPCSIRKTKVSAFPAIASTTCCNSALTRHVSTAGTHYKHTPACFATRESKRYELDYPNAHTTSTRLWHATRTDLADLSGRGDGKTRKIDTSEIIGTLLSDWDKLQIQPNGKQLHVSKPGVMRLNNSNGHVCIGFGTIE
jgi:hypothetical protein